MNDRSSSLIDSSSDETGSDQAEWLDAESDEESLVFYSLCDSRTFDSLPELLLHCKIATGFDLVATVRQLKLDFHGAVKLVNYIRQCLKSGTPASSAISWEEINQDRYLQPVLENDAVIFSLDEILDSESDLGQDGRDEQSGPGGSDAPPRVTLTAREKELINQLSKIQNEYSNYRLAVEETLDKRWAEQSANPDKQANSFDEEKNSGYDDYFESYAANEIHEVMLKDAIRTDAYRDFIYENKQIFSNKIVLDIGCGTGILSMFCAKAGAKKVIAVDKSNIITKAIDNVVRNNLSSTITCLKGAIEEVVLPVDKVDIIVSEWMGYCLLYEAMLPSVLFARDKYLKPDGLLVPSHAVLRIAPFSDPQYVSDNIAYWRDVYGFDMKAMQEGIYDDARVEVVPEQSICGTSHPFRIINLSKVQVDDLVFTTNWRSSLYKDIDGLGGFVIWFDTFFATSSSGSIVDESTTPDGWAAQQAGQIALTTGPFTKDTHWKQGLLLTPTKQPEEHLKVACQLTGTVKFVIAENNARALAIHISWAADDQEQRERKWDLK